MYLLPVHTDKGQIVRLTATIRQRERGMWHVEIGHVAYTETCRHSRNQEYGNTKKNKISDHTRFFGALRFVGAETFFTGAFVFVVETLGLLADVPVRVFLAGARFAAIFLVTVGFVFFLVVLAFFTGFTALEAALAEDFALPLAPGLAVFLVDIVAVFLVAAAFLAAVAGFFERAPVVAVFFASLPADFFSATGFLAALAFAATGVGAAFSLPASERALGANFTFPEGPFGRTNSPFSAPCAIALFMLVTALAEISRRYLVSKNFLIVGRLTPARASAGCATMHSLIISAKGGWEAAAAFFLPTGDFFTADIVEDNEEQVWRKYLGRGEGE